MKTYVLVHGSWHGAWNWHRVMPILEAAGHHAFAPDLPAHGRDTTPTRVATLDHCVDFLCAFLNGIEGKVILLGHSKNGIVISQVAERCPEKIEKLVYLAAYLIPDGKCQRDYAMQDKEGVLKPHVTFHAETNATTLAPAIYREGLYADCGEEIIALANVMLRPEPFDSAITPLQLSDGKFGSVPRIYIACTNDKAVGPAIQRKMYTEMPCAKVFTMNTSHSPFFSRPAELAAILMEL